MAEPTGDRPHLFVRDSARPEPYTYPLPVRGGKKPNLPPRSRNDHGRSLLDALEQARRELETLGGERDAVGVADQQGLYLEFASEPEFDLVIDSLDRVRDGIELVNVRLDGARTLATVFVGEGRLQKFVKLIEDYLGKETEKGKPKNQPLVDGISSIQRAALEAFWTDDRDLLPAETVAIWWEVWLRAGPRGEEREDILRGFRDHGTRLGLRITEPTIDFVDRTVVLAHGAREAMATSVELLDCIAELRCAKETPAFFTSLSAREQAEWVTNLLERITAPVDAAPAVCLLDTGVNSGHPLLDLALADTDRLTCNPTWGADDHDSHGTEMAGLALYGDLAQQLGEKSPVVLVHRLESVKLLPPQSNPPNDPELYGAITKQAVARAEIAQPRRSRVICMPIMTRDFRDRGRPSSWSAAVDNICGGFEGDHERLFIVPAGNVERDDWRHYPDRNDADQIHDPGQSWNALTVGAFTERVMFDAQNYPGFDTIARPGALSPCSTTSMIWQPGWPNKPDIVLEGGNGIRHQDTGEVDSIDDLALLSTHWRPTEKLLVATGDTSGAATQGARMAAILMARYPSLWPETIRALLVHSANWTDRMRDDVLAAPGGNRRDLLLRRYGYGVPDLRRACWSASNIVTLVAEERLRPYVKGRGESRVKTSDLNLHELPWPRAELQALGEEVVELRVTLSYFVEPNPARRGHRTRFRYQSHGLRFSMKKGSESLDDFRKRVSKDAQDEENDIPSPGDGDWQLGRSRDRGSIHSDRWQGPAVELAERGHLAVFPVGGWWKERPQFERWKRKVRYSLIVTIESPDTEVDLYTPVEQRLPVPTTVPIVI